MPVKDPVSMSRKRRDLKRHTNSDCSTMGARMSFGLPMLS